MEMKWFKTSCAQTGMSLSKSNMHSNNYPNSN
jgi:hypothetical protein